MPYFAPGTGYTNLQDFLQLNQGAAQQMGQRAAAGVQQAGQQAQNQLGAFQDQFQKMLASAQGQPGAPATPSTAGGGAPPAPSPGSGAAAGGRLGPGGKFGGGAKRTIMGGAQRGAMDIGKNVQREPDLYSRYANADLSKLTADRLSGLSGWTGALSGAQQAATKARQLGGGQAGLSALLGDQAGPGYYGGRGRALDSYLTANSGVDFAPVSDAWKGIANAYGLADVASAGEADKLKSGAAAWQAQQAAQPLTLPTQQEPARRGHSGPAYRVGPRDVGGSNPRRRIA